MNFKLLWLLGREGVVDQSIIIVSESYHVYSTTRSLDDDEGKAHKLVTNRNDISHPAVLG